MTDLSPPSKPVLYSFRRCPYAIRARLAIVYAKVGVELREVVLKEKPKEMLELSPKGTVPVLNLGLGKVLEESLDIMYWALGHNDSEGWLAGLTESQKRDSEELISINDGEFKQHLDHYKYFDRFPEQSKETYRAQGEVFLSLLDERLSRQSHLLSENFSFADAAIFPFIRQFAHVDKKWFDQSRYQHLQQWLERLLQSELFLGVMKKYPPYQPGDEPVEFP